MTSQFYPVASSAFLNSSLQSMQLDPTHNQTVVKTIKTTTAIFSFYSYPGESLLSRFDQIINRQLQKENIQGSLEMESLVHFLADQTEYDFSKKPFYLLGPLRDFSSKFSMTLPDNINRIEKLFPLNKKRKELLLLSHETYKSSKSFNGISEYILKLALIGTGYENSPIDSEIGKTLNALISVLLGETKPRMDAIFSIFSNKIELLETILINIFTNNFYSLSLLDEVTVNQLTSIYKALGEELDRPKLLSKLPPTLREVYVREPEPDLGVGTSSDIIPMADETPYSKQAAAELALSLYENGAEEAHDSVMESILPEPVYRRG
ncbi:MAG: hypothetical protein PVI40_06310 [Chlamydiota bacterium]|jgi:hypothetical protein